MTMSEKRVYIERLDAERARVAEKHMRQVGAEKAFNELPREWACEALARIEVLENK
jgi:hypothetical protein